MTAATVTWLHPCRTQAVGRFCLLALLLAGPGCDDEAEPAVYPATVQGRVTLRGLPLTSGTVALVPLLAEEAGGVPGLARIEADGTYVIGNANTRKAKGVKPGTYKVVIYAVAAEPKASGPPEFRLLTPPEFADPATTPWQREIAAGAHVLDFDLP